ncbi:MAG: hypothetical protein V4608_05770 [Bacteroidota bacterium]
MQVFSQEIDASRFIATLQFDDRYWDFLVPKSEQSFPISFSFNLTQDGNADGVIDVEDACENMVEYAIGDSIYGIGRTGLTLRGANDQRPAVYFHFVKDSEYDVYQYWLYYSDNDYVNDHEHDWEKYFVYVKNGTPAYVRISHHKRFDIYRWDELFKDADHIIVGVKGGSHAMNNKQQKGVQIRYNGDVSKRLGKLCAGEGKNFQWQIFSNDPNVMKAVNYIQKPDCFYNGDPVYPSIPGVSISKEYKECSPAPWLRSEWNNPPKP